jgi:dTDP-4-amino-4,6-dideoxygalactose transaminase
VIAISAPVLGELEEKFVVEVLRSGRLVHGPMVEAFEDAVRTVSQARHAVAVSSGTSALIAALLAHGIGPGDEVITSPFTFVATLNAVLLVGATPRFVDIDDDYNLDLSLLEAAIGPATRAVLPVHLYGCPVDMARLSRVVHDRDIVVVEDGAQALGATAAGRAVGSYGTGCFSFYATKNVTTGEGGVVTTDDGDIASKVRMLIDQGQRATYDYARAGFNFRMTEMQAALGVAQMTRLPELLDARRANASALAAGLEGVPGLVVPTEPAGRRHVFHQFTVRVTNEASATRDELRSHLEREGVQSRVYYPRPVFDYDCFRRDDRIGTPSTPRAARAAREVLSLPVHPRLTAHDIEVIVEATRRGLR